MLRTSEDGSAVALDWNDGDRWTTVEISAPRFRHRDPSDPYLANDDMVEYSVRLLGDGLAAQALVLSLDAMGSGLLGFVEQLAADFRGWEGARTWQNADHDLTVEATWTTRGYVKLRWSITPSLHDRWTASAEVEVEAGAEMVALAQNLSAFFAI